MPSPFVRLVAFACVIGYAVPAVAAPRAATPATIVNIDPSLDGLSAEARKTYAAQHVALERQGAKATEYRLMRGGRLLTEREFRATYRDVTHSTDLDIEARARAKRKNGRAIAGAVGLTLLGIGGLTTLGLVQPSVCSRAANTQNPGGCGKVGESVVILALMSGYGIYSLGCEAVKGVNCLLDGNIAPVGNELTQAETLPFVDRYNAALVATLRAGVALNRLGAMGRTAAECEAMTDETLELSHAGDVVSIVPARGALITRWRAGGTARLYLDESTLVDPTKNVRGGVPLLFPSPGKLADGRYSRAGKTGAMKQHGFARDLAWVVVARDEASATLTLSSSRETRAVFPWEFALTLRITLSAARVRLALDVSNPGTEPLPFGFGVHPYFLVRDKADATVSTAATRAFDNVTQTTGPFAGFHLGEGETDLHLLDHGSTTSTLAISRGERVTVRTSPEFGRWVVWTLPGKEFVCLEPWTAPGNALNTGEGLISLAPGDSRALWIEFDAA